MKATLDSVLRKVLIGKEIWIWRCNNKDGNHSYSAWEPDLKNYPHTKSVERVKAIILNLEVMDDVYEGDHITLIVKETDKVTDTMPNYLKYTGALFVGSLTNAFEFVEDIEVMEMDSGEENN